MFKLTYFIALGALLFDITLACDVSKINVKVFSDSTSAPETVPLTPNAIKHAQKLVVSGQNIPDLCAGMFDGSIVQTIEFSDNKIGKIEPGAFGNARYLSNLILTHNALTEIPPNVFDGVVARKLNISYNNIAKIDAKSFEKMPNLDVVDMSHNKLKTIDANWFKTNEKLGWVILDHNLLDEIPEGFLSFNVAHEIPLYIWIRNNAIKKIHPGAFQNINTVRVVFLSSNKLSTLPQNMFKQVTKVENLYLDHNDLTCLEEPVFAGLKMVEEVFVHDNTIQCDCLKQMKAWGKKNGVKVTALARTIECYQEKLSNLKKAYGS